MTKAAPPPATPSRGNGPQPKIMAGDKGRTITAPAKVTIAGTLTFPAPRRADDSNAVIQIGMAPENTTPE
jgi:hypothetical protein